MSGVPIAESQSHTTAGWKHPQKVITSSNSSSWSLKSLCHVVDYSEPVPPTGQGTPNLGFQWLCFWIVLGTSSFVSAPIGLPLTSTLWSRQNSFNSPHSPSLLFHRSVGFHHLHIKFKLFFWVYRIPQTLGYKDHKLMGPNISRKWWKQGNLIDSKSRNLGSCWDREQRASWRPAFHLLCSPLHLYILFLSLSRPHGGQDLGSHSSWVYFFQSGPIWNLSLPIPNSWKTISGPDWIQFNQGDQGKGVKCVYITPESV